jgi:hypothetical protein
LKLIQVHFRYIRIIQSNKTENGSLTTEMAPTITNKNDLYHCGQCPICQDDFTFAQSGMLPCGHLFHQECILKWMKKSTQCPNCREECARPQNILRMNVTPPKYGPREQARNNFKKYRCLFFLSAHWRLFFDYLLEGGKLNEF